jgi:hypothetical protein
MKQLLAAGATTTVEAMQRELYSFVKTQVPAGASISEHNRSYYPSRATLEELLWARGRQLRSAAVAAAVDTEQQPSGGKRPRLELRSAHRGEAFSHTSLTLTLTRSLTHSHSFSFTHSLNSNIGLNSLRRIV